MNPEENSNFDFEEYSGRIVSEKQANNQLKRQNRRIKAHMAAIMAGAIIALTACTYEEIEKNADQEVEVTETGGIPFSEEKISELQGDVSITNAEALENAYKNQKKDLKDHSITETGGIPFNEEKISKLQEDVTVTNTEALGNAYKNPNEALANDSITSEEKELIRRTVEQEANDTQKDLTYIAGRNQKNSEAKDLTQTQVIVKQAIDNALRINEIIGKNGLSESELEQVIKNSEAERKKSKETKEQVTEAPLDDTDLEYWKISDTTYEGINPPEDTMASVWIPTGEQTPYQKLENGVYKSDPTWRQVSLEFDKVMHHMSYGNACPMNPETDSIDLIPVYVTADFAIRKNNPLKEKKQYQEFLDAKIGTANALIAGIYVPIEKVDGVTSFDNIGFTLEKTNAEGKTEVVGYINGNDLVESLSRNMADIFQEEVTNTQENVTSSSLQH